MSKSEREDDLRKFALDCAALERKKSSDVLEDARKYYGFLNGDAAPGIIKMVSKIAKKGPRK